jgi:heme oxygenase
VITRSLTRTPGAIATLKALTAVDRDALERRLDLDHRLRSRRSYVALLKRMLGFYRPLELDVAVGAISLRLGRTAS